MTAFKAKFVVSTVEAMGARVIGLVECMSNHCVIASRSYVCPSLATTGSAMTLHVIGHKKPSGITDASEDDDEVDDIPAALEEGLEPVGVEVDCTRSERGGVESERDREGESGGESKKE